MLKRIFGGKKISPPESTSIGMDAALTGLSPIRTDDRRNIIE